MVLETLGRFVANIVWFTGPERAFKGDCEPLLDGRAGRKARGHCRIYAKEAFALTRCARSTQQLAPLQDFAPSAPTEEADVLCDFSWCNTSKASQLEYSFGRQWNGCVRGGAATKRTVKHHQLQWRRVVVKLCRSWESEEWVLCTPNL